jgi:hypothetical protein
MGVSGAHSRDPSAGQPPLSVTTQLPQNNTGPRKAIAPTSGTGSPVAGVPPSDTFPVSRVNTGESMAITSPGSTPSDYQARRDYSPTAVPSPLNTRASMGSQTAADYTARLPPRKSSLSQVMRPDLSEDPRTPDDASPKPWITSPGRTSSPGRPTTSGSGKALPFVRPADIYRRVEEDRKEKERQSMESSRPSMDSIGMSRPGEGSSSPAPIINEERPSSGQGSLGKKVLAATIYLNMDDDRP